MFALYATRYSVKTNG